MAFTVAGMTYRLLPGDMLLASGLELERMIDLRALASVEVLMSATASKVRLTTVSGRHLGFTPTTHENAEALAEYLRGKLLPKDIRYTPDMTAFGCIWVYIYGGQKIVRQAVDGVVATFDHHTPSLAANTWVDLQASISIGNE